MSLKITKAISILKNMAVNLTGELGALSEDNPKVEMLTEYIEAINMAQEALKWQLEKENNKDNKTKGEILRTMSDEELAEFISDCEENVLRAIGKELFSENFIKSLDSYNSWLKRFQEPLSL